MVKAVIVSILSLSLCIGAAAQDYNWKRSAVDGARTGVSAGKGSVENDMGHMKGRRYIAPNGRSYKGRTAKVASEMLGVQPQMARIKEVIAYSPKEMVSHRPESELSNWFIDVLMSKCEELSGKKVDFGLVNFGGIRVDMPVGDVLVDDIQSMFPFRNKLVYMQMYGKEIRSLLEMMARSGFQVIGGVRCVVKDRQLVEATIGGEPLDDEKTYGVCTIDFLLQGGDNLAMANHGFNIEVLDKYIMDIMVPYVREQGKLGNPITYSKDGRVTIIND